MRFLIVVQGVVIKHIVGREKALEEFEKIKKAVKEEDKLAVHLAQIIQS